MRLDFEDGTKTIEDKQEDTFFVGFNAYLFLRESCYNCRYCGTERIADITLGDYWGIDLSTISEQQRKNGVSLVVANNDKGEFYVNKLSEYMVIDNADKDRAIAANQAFRMPSSVNEDREEFFAKIDTIDFDRLVHRYNRKVYFKLGIRRILGDKLYDLLKKLSGRA